MSAHELFSATVRIASEGPDVTWIGANPLASGLCLGFDDGSIVLYFEATGITTPHHPISPAKEAVNGVAAIASESLAISTRAEVSFIQIKGRSTAVYQGGAHGVVATRSGFFIAPLGPRGLLFVKPETGPKQRMHVTTGTEGHLYFYRATALFDVAGKETLVFANRRNGVGMSEFNGKDVRGSVHTMTFEGLDVVDVCGVSPGSLSAIAISPRAEVLWIKDTSRRDDPVAIKLSGTEGPAYRVLATPQTLFVLTSKGLYVWANLVTAMMGGGKRVAADHPLVLPLEAVDMALHGDHLLLVMAENAIMSLGVKELAKRPTDETLLTKLPKASLEMASKAEAHDFTPDWRRNDVEHSMLAGAT